MRSERRFKDDVPARCKGLVMQKEDAGMKLYEEPYFTFRFAEDRIIPRFHLEGVEAGRRVSVFTIDPGTGERLRLIAMATVGGGGWVDLPEPITVRAGDAFVAVPEEDNHESSDVLSPAVVRRLRG